MKQIILSFAILLLFNLCLTAQEDKDYKKMNLGKFGTVGISAGYNAPVGDFADDDVDNANAGYAQGGISLNLNGTYRIGRYIGLAATIKSQANGFNETGFVDNLSQLDPDASWSLDADPFSSLAVLVGGYTAFPLTFRRKFIWESKILLGSVGTIYPEINATSEEGGTTTETSIESSSAAAFGAMISTGIRYNISVNWGLTADVDFLTSYLNYNDVAVESTNPAIDDTIDYNLSLNTIGFNIGLVYRFGEDPNFDEETE